MKLKIVLFLTMLPFAVGCRGVDRLLGTSTEEPGTPKVPPHGPAAVADAVPVYDQTTATTTQDDRLIEQVIGQPGTEKFITYCASSWLPERMNGYAPFYPGTGVSSILVDAWKALYRRGYADVSKLNDPGVIHSNAYPVPVYQGDASSLNL